jgi:hypothetical protein
MFSQWLIRLKRVFGGLPLILFLLHTALMFWVGFIWYQAAAEYPNRMMEANFGFSMVCFVDFPIVKLCDWCIATALHSKSHALGSILEWIIGDDIFRYLGIHFSLPLLLFLGSIQWFLIGLGIECARKLIYFRSVIRPRFFVH